MAQPPGYPDKTVWCRWCEARESWAVHRSEHPDCPTCTTPTVYRKLMRGIEDHDGSKNLPLRLRVYRGNDMDR